MWLYLWALMESWLMAVDCVERYAKSWSCIQGSSRNHVNEGKTNNHRWMLYSVYAVLGVNSWSCHGEIERDDLTLYSAMMVELWTRKRDGGWRLERYGGYEQIWEIRGTTCLIGLGRPRIGVSSRRIGTGTCRIGDGQLTRTRNSRKSQFLMMISPISSNLCRSCAQLYHHLRTRS